MRQQPGGRFAATTTRRTVVKTGAKLAYAAPLVAATMKLTADSALAASGGGLICDDLSPKHARGSTIEYTCKAPSSGSGCGDSTRDGDDSGSIQVEVGFAGSTPYCYCQSNQCEINGVMYAKRAQVGVCQPVLLSTVNCV